MNRQDIAAYGEEADYRRDPNGAIVGCIGAGVIYVAIITVIVASLIRLGWPSNVFDGKNARHVSHVLPKSNLGKRTRLKFQLSP